MFVMPPSMLSTVSCESCGREFQFNACPSNVRLGRGRFCSKTCQIAWQRVPLRTRFEKHIGPTTDTGCILWMGTISEGRYGVIHAGGKDSPRIYAHRLAYEIANGPIPDGMSIMHSCDNPRCINAEHLSPGTITDNMTDKIHKNRQAKGEVVASSKLTVAAVREIRERHAGGDAATHLARDYGVSIRCIGKITKRDTWRHV